MQLQQMQTTLGKGKQVFLSTGEAAAALEVSPQTVRRWIANGQLSVVQLPSGVFRIPRSEIERILTPKPVSADSPAEMSELSGQDELF